jgi:dienelactone hydrolase
MPSVRSADVYQPPAYVNPDTFTEEPVTLDAGGFPLPGTLTLPKTPGRRSAVVLVHGSGPHDQDETIISNKPFRDLAQGLATRGVAVLRYEKRTHKYPQGIKPEDCTLDWETIDDAVAAAKLLRGHDRVNPGAVFVAGHSLGAMAAPFIARKDGELAGVILLAGNARSILDLLEEQVAYIAGVDGQVTDEEKAQLEQLRQVTANVRAGKLDADAAAAGLPMHYLARLHALRPVEVAGKLTRPMLILQGARDYQVTTEDFAIWKRELKGRSGVTFHLYDDLNHLFMSGAGKSTPAEYQQVGHVDERVIRDIADWLERIAAGAKG